jgi:hypothetical protein
MAAWVADAAKQPAVVPPSIAARNARRMEIRQERGDASDDEIESATPVIQSTTIALDLMEQGSRQPQATVKHAIESYFEDQ